MRFRETKFWRRGQWGLLLALLLVLEDQWSDLEEAIYNDFPLVPYRPVCRPAIEDHWYRKRRFFDGPWRPRFRELLLRNVEREHKDGFWTVYLVVGGRIFVSQRDADGWGGFDLAQHDTIQELAREGIASVGPLPPREEERVRSAIDAAFKDPTSVDFRNCDLVRAIAIEGG